MRRRFHALTLVLVAWLVGSIASAETPDRSSRVVCGFGLTCSSGTDAMTASVDSAALQPRNYGIDVGQVNRFRVELGVLPGAFSDGLRVLFKARAANTGPSTLALNSSEPRPLVAGREALTAGAILASEIVEAVYELQCECFQILSGARRATPAEVPSSAGAYKYLPVDFLSEGAVAMMPLRTANRVYVWKFYLPFRMTARSMSFHIAGAAPGKASIGIYANEGREASAIRRRSTRRKEGRRSRR